MPRLHASHRALLAGTMFAFQRGAAATFRRLYVTSRKRPLSSTSKPSSLWERYTRLLEEHPMATKVVTSGVIMGGGDAACQCITVKEWSDYEPRRTFKFALLGAAWVAPLLHVWYGLLGRMFPAQTTASVLQRLAMDQLIFAPSFIPIFFVQLQFLDGDFDTGKIQKKLEADYWDTLLGNWVLWVPAQLINFRYIPGKYQVLYSNMIGFVWNIYMSFQSFKE